MNPFRQTLWRLARTVFGLAVGAFLTSAVAMGLNGDLIVDSALRPRLLSDILTATSFVLLFALPVGLIGHAVLYALKQRTLAYYAGLGGIGGGIFAAIFFHDEAGQVLSNVLKFALWATACAAIAWFIRRPDKDFVKLPDPASHF